jgi:hypothetical protein
MSDSTVALASQSLIVLSNDPDASFVHLGENTIALTLFECPKSFFKIVPESASHGITVVS